jgi:translation initiation factor IF-2
VRKTKTTIADLAREAGRDPADIARIAENVLGKRVTAGSMLGDDAASRVRTRIASAAEPSARLGTEREIVVQSAAGSAVLRDTRVTSTVIRRRRSPVVVDAGRADGAARSGNEHAKQMGSTPLAASATAVPVTEPQSMHPNAPAPAPELAVRPDESPHQQRARVDLRSHEPSVQPQAGPQHPRILGRIDLAAVRSAARPSSAAPERRSEPQAGTTPPARRTLAGMPPKGAERPASRGLPERRRRQVARLDSGRRNRDRMPKRKWSQPGRAPQQTEITTPKASKRVARISQAISVADLARAMGVKAGEVLKSLMGMGVTATINHTLDVDTATLVASEFDYAVENVAYDADAAIDTVHRSADDTVALRPRPAVATVMGHVDHGKTSLLDALRETDVAAGEAGGITQHSGAYTVTVGGRAITFIDTPGHEAFTAIRARGAQVTDVVVLVVAADDGVMPQTVEAIDHARAAHVPIVVAVNKIDKPQANLTRVKADLANHGLASEDWGGDTPVVPVSALTHAGLPELLEILLLQADVLELRANAEKLARGVVLEAKLDRGRGTVATVLVHEGTLRTGDPFVCGTVSGRVRTMRDWRGNDVAHAGPSAAVEVVGFRGMPEPGDGFAAMSDEATAKEVAEHRATIKRQAAFARTAKVSLADFSERLAAGERRDLRVVVKADVQGSVEALRDALVRLSTDEVGVTVLHAAVGAITENDVLLASASHGCVLGFQVRADAQASKLAAREGVEIHRYSVIYEALRDVRAALEGMLAPEEREHELGRVEVRQIFLTSSAGAVPGCVVSEGKAVRGAGARVIRDGTVVWTGTIASLRRFKDDVREVAAGYECGVVLAGYDDARPGDVIRVYEIQRLARRLTTSEPGASARAA